jgi:hypothetical protein
MEIRNYRASGFVQIPISQQWFEGIDGDQAGSDRRFVRFPPDPRPRAIARPPPTHSTGSELL